MHRAYNYLVKDIADLPRVLHEAFLRRRQRAARAGGGHDVPKDVVPASGLYARPNEFHHKGYQPKLKGDPDRIKAAVELMRMAKRPLFYTGGGVVNSGRQPRMLLRELVGSPASSPSPRR
ncbi:MAG: hypothetical protein R3D52_13300 [Xanthobacteraceae bacterium]